jgi:hypothetical protein
VLTSGWVIIEQSLRVDAVKVRKDWNAALQMSIRTFDTNAGKQLSKAATDVYLTLVLKK